MKRKELIACVVLFVIASFGWITLIIYANIRYISEANTTEFAATVVSVSTEREHVIIYTEEFGDRLTTFGIRDLYDISDFTNLENGQTVFFRLENIWAERFKELLLPFPIVSLRTEEVEIVSLSSFNEHRANMHTWVTVAGIVFFLFFLLLAIYFALRLKKDRARVVLSAE